MTWVISKIVHCTILQKKTISHDKRKIRRLNRLNPVSLLHRLCIWWLAKLFTAQFYKKRKFHKTKNMTTKSSVCIWRLVKLIAAQFYKKDNFSRRRNTTTKLTKTCVKPVLNLYFFLIKTNLDAQKAPLVQSISRFQQVLLPFYVGTHTDPTPVGSTEDSTCPNSKPSH